MNDSSRDRHRPFDEIVQDLKREHRHRHGRSRRSRPATLAQRDHRKRLHWVAAVALGLALAVMIGWLIPTK